jgi:hypothetical protein
METEGHEGVLSGPHHYDGDIYYAEVKWDGYAIANSNKKYQFAIGTYAYQNTWDVSDDWSHQGIRIEENPFLGTVERTDYICVYRDGVLYGGTEPDGTTPSIGEDNDKKEYEKGDLNLDGVVDLTDLSILAIRLLEDTELDENQLYAADVTEDGDIDLRDLASLKIKIMRH